VIVGRPQLAFDGSVEATLAPGSRPSPPRGFDSEHPSIRARHVTGAVNEGGSCGPKLDHGGRRSWSAPLAALALVLGLAARRREAELTQLGSAGDDERARPREPSVALPRARSTFRPPIPKILVNVTIDQLRGDELAGVRILVVEDEPETLELVSLTLRSAGADVVEANGAEMALAKLDGHAPHVVLSDLQMPGLDGYELMRILRKRSTPAVAVALSASASLEDARRALEAGFSVHVAKPIAMTDLVETVRAVVPPPSLTPPPFEPG